MDGATPTPARGRRRAARTSFAPLVVAALAGLVGCDEGPDDPPVRIRLAECLGGDLLPAHDPFRETVLVDEDFTGGAAGWSRLVDSENPLAEDPELLEVATGAGEGRSFASLSGTRGALYRVLPAEPNACYTFRCLVRARDLEPASQPFFGAAPSLAELSEFGPVRELLEKGIEERIVARQLFLSTYREEGWQVQTKTFRTGPRTRGLLLVCSLGLTEDVAAGAVDFAEVELRRVSERSYHRTLLARDAATFALGEPPLTGWRAERRVKALQGAELRPGIVLFPGDRLRFRLHVPARRPLFESGVGTWRPALEDQLALGRRPAVTFRVSVDERPVLTVEEHAPERLVETRWRELSVDLRARSGETIDLELAVEGDVAGVFGAPLLREHVPQHELPNLLLVSIDTLRADHVGAYGYGEETTPRLDAFAEGAIRFAHVVSQSPYTLPSHTSLFSGQFPSVHGVQRGGDVISSQRSPILARILARRGYRTRAFTGGGFLSPTFGFDKGFDGFGVIDPLRHRDSAYLGNLVKREPDLYSPALIDANGVQGVEDWLTEHEDEPFFLFLHTYTVHDYDPPAEFVRCPERGCAHEAANWHEFRLRGATGWTPHPHTAEDRAHLNHSYDDALRYVDHLLGRVLDHLDRLRLTENTIVAVTTDHGEELLERGFVQHGKSLYEEVTRIPMIVRIPGEPGRVLEHRAMQIDLLPTLLAAMGIPADPRSQGVDLLSTPPAPRVTWSEIHDDFAHRYTVRSEDGWKLIHSPPDDTIVFPNLVEWELFDLAGDAGESTNLAADRPGRLEALRALLEEQQAAMRSLAELHGDVDRTEIDAETLRQLEALGYL